ncbi:hypothetical protein STAQ_05070 [Allostella sp. ATCC 35155]|nr:hypothetical protein STAQ_05070 [Stella sp. ATCC 35155]
MQDSYRVVPLTRAHVLPAYPLVHAYRPELSLAAWRVESNRHVAGSARSRRGAFVAESDQGYLTGVALHRVGSDSLEVECFAVLALIDAFGIAGALLARLEEVARAAGCGAVRVLLPCRLREQAERPRSQESRSAAAAFTFAGYGATGTILRKTLD